MIKQTFAAILAALAIALATTSALPTPSQAAGPDATASRLVDRDCGDFSTQAGAQQFYVNAGGPSSDPHALDSDGDGVACESNPCPCSTSTSHGNGGGDHPSEGPTRPPLEVDRAVVVKVVDGDTVDVRLNKSQRTVRVRLLGIDTPEVYGGRQCWGRQASRAAKQILPRGTRVTLTSDRTQPLEDRYDRLLRYVRKDSNRADVGKVQLRRGNAKVYVVSKPFDRVRSYKASQTQARRADRGLWGGC